MNGLAFPIPDKPDADFNEIAHDAFHVASDISHFGELRRFDLQEGRARQFRKPSRNLRLADTRRTDHQDVLWQHLILQVASQLLPAPTVAQSYSNGALGVVLTDDVAVKFGYDFAGRKVGHESR